MARDGQKYRYLEWAWKSPLLVDIFFYLPLSNCMKFYCFIFTNISLQFRISRYRQFKDFQKRILVATNLFGRGMDIERVNIVVNYDMPEDSDTYLHRVSRVGCFA